MWDTRKCQWSTNRKWLLGYRLITSDFVRSATLRPKLIPVYFWCQKPWKYWRCEIDEKCPWKTRSKFTSDAIDWWRRFKPTMASRAEIGFSLFTFCFFKLHNARCLQKPQIMYYGQPSFVNDKYQDVVACNTDCILSLVSCHVSIFFR